MTLVQPLRTVLGVVTVMDILVLNSHVDESADVDFAAWADIDRRQPELAIGELNAGAAASAGSDFRAAWSGEMPIAITDARCDHGAGAGTGLAVNGGICCWALVVIVAAAIRRPSTDAERSLRTSLRVIVGTGLAVSRTGVDAIVVVVFALLFVSDHARRQW